MAGAPKQVSIIPDLPRSPNVVDKNGNLEPEWKLFFEQLIQGLQKNLKPEGILFPQQTAANITQLTTINSLANIVYDSTNNLFKGNVQTSISPPIYTWKTFVLA